MGYGAGELRIYLGAAPGVGKTYAMLCEAHRRAERGTDVVVGLVETHGRAKTAKMIDGLDVVPRRTVSYRGVELTELDVDAVLARAPQVVLVDELAHTNAPGSRHAKRWQDIEDLLEAGINVLTTVNIQHLESLNDVIERITGVRQQETVPDEVVRRAQQVELVDITPEALRRRMAHGNVYAPERVDAAMANYFQPRNLTALREMALLWLADQVEVALQRYRTDQQITDIWETRERVVVALTGGPESETVLRRAARIAERTESSDLFAVHVLRGDGLAGAPVGAVAGLRRLAENVGAPFHTVVGDHVPTALLEFARGVDATQLVIGTSRRSRLARVLVESIGTRVVQDSGHIDVHMVTHPEAGRGMQPAPPVQRGPGHAPSHGMGAERAAAAHRRRDRDPRQGPPRALDRRRPVLPRHRDRRTRRRARPGPARRRCQRPAAQLLPDPAPVHLHHLRTGERHHAGGHGAGGGPRRPRRRPRRTPGAAGRAGPDRGHPARLVLPHRARPQRSVAPAAGEDPGGVRPHVGGHPAAQGGPLDGLRVHGTGGVHPPRGRRCRRRGRHRHPPRR